MKVILTASREWDDRELLEGALVWCHDWARRAGEGLVVVHGDARGGDTMAKKWVVFMTGIGHDDVDDVPYPADWKGQGVAAGNRRNTYMVDVNYDADLCVGFPRATSVGTLDCMAKAEARGIPVWRIPWDCETLPPPPTGKRIPFEMVELDE